mgnify:CR=1 FL=1
MAQKNISFRIEDQKKQSLDNLAQSLGYDRSTVLNQAIDVFLSVYDWQKTHIRESQKQAREGKFVSEKEWRLAFNRERL